MGERRIYETQYSDLSGILRKPSNSSKKIEKSDKEAWMAYVKKHNVPEAAVLSRGKSGTMSGKLDVVIIDGAGASDGYYVYSADESFCVKFESGLEE
jgi:hypothetical protein